MATITGLTAARMAAIEAASIVSGYISGDDLILTRFDATTVNAGNVRGPAGTDHPTIVTSLPGSPTDGEEVYVQTAAMATANIMWHAKYRTAIGKWEVLGNTSLYSGGASLDVAPGGDGVWTELSTANASLTIPVAGLYDVHFGASAQENVGGAVSGDLFLSLYKNGASVTSQVESWARLTSGYDKATLRNVARLTFAANDVIRPRGNVTAGSWNNYRWKSAFVYATPVRLG